METPSQRYGRKPTNERTDFRFTTADSSRERDQTAGKDDANKPAFGTELMKKKRATRVRLILYQGANHGFMTKAPDRTFQRPASELHRMGLRKT
jgi:dienelactone hydrolase